MTPAILAKALRSKGLSVRTRGSRITITATTSGPTFRQCRERAHTLHAFDADFCDCLRREVPPEHRALSSGRLGTPERARRCPDCSGLGRVTLEGCPRCFSTGELAYRTSPEIPDSSAASGRGGK